MKAPVPLLLILPIAISGCATRPAEVGQAAPASRPTASLPVEDVNGVRYAESVEAYPISRYIDPNSPGIMHEGHTVYRIATTPRWNLRSNSPATVPAGARVAHQDAALNQAPVNDEL